VSNISSCLPCSTQHNADIAQQAAHTALAVACTPWRQAGCNSSLRHLAGGTHVPQASTQPLPLASSTTAHPGRHNSTQIHPNCYMMLTHSKRHTQAAWVLIMHARRAPHRFCARLALRPNHTLGSGPCESPCCRYSVNTEKAQNDAADFVMLPCSPHIPVSD
jgi:hypothetical protein